jgi:hypothetical protein
MAKQKNRPTLRYDKTGAPRWEPFKITVNQVGGDLREANQLDTGASEADAGHGHILHHAIATKDDRSAVAVAWRIKHQDFEPLAYVVLPPSMLLKSAKAPTELLSMPLSL